MQCETFRWRWLLGLRWLRSSKKSEILQIRLILRVAKWKNITFYYGRKKQGCFLVFTDEICFYSVELFFCAVNFKFYLNIFIFLNITQIKHQRSNIWIKKQALTSGSAVQRGFESKVSGLQFHRCFIQCRCFWKFWSHFSDLFFAELLIT